jgi:hypothetical protein
MIFFILFPPKLNNGCWYGHSEKQAKALFFADLLRLALGGLPSHIALDYISASEESQGNMAIYL